MKWLKRLYYRTGWQDVFNFVTELGSGRTYLLFFTVSSAVLNGLSGGIFYTGLLVGFGINIVNISIITFIPYIASLIQLISPYILQHFKKRRTFLTVLRTLYHTIHILGITVLPQLITDPTGRVVGLIAITFLSSVIIGIQGMGYSAWHIPYITEDVRNNYHTATTLVSNAISSILLIVVSSVTDRLEGDAQLRLIIALRYVAFAVSLLEIYFLQKPKEPEYPMTVDRPRVVHVFKIPLSNKRFLLFAAVMGLYSFVSNIPNSVLNTWLLQEVKVSYSYINVINSLYVFAIIGTSSLWNRYARRHGTWETLAMALLVHAPTYLVYAFVNQGNYIWLMTLVRLSQHAIGMLLVMAAGNPLYVSLPEKDQDNYLSFYNIVMNIAPFLGMSLGTAIVAAVGDRAWNVLGASIGGVPLLLLLECVGYVLLSGLIMLLRKKLGPVKAPDV